jgi:uncharacterized protein YjbJ (UPF0337 family)
MADRINDSTDGRLERAKDSALGKHDDHPSHVDEAGEAAGGIGGVLAGAAIGSVAGPVGTLIGGIAGAMGGWWAGRAVTEATSKLTTEDDEYYRGRYESSPNRLADRSYDDVRPAYHLGQIASQNPDYANMEWGAVQADLQRGWTAEQTKKYGDWNTVSGYASEGFNRGRLAFGNTASGAGAIRGNTYDRAATGAETAANKVADKVDDLKDRVDGNPASRPGPDATDSSRRLDAR